MDINIDGKIVDASSEQVYKEFFGDNTTTSYKSFRNQVDNIPDIRTVNIYINSEGGNVTEAMAIHDLITEWQKKGITVNTKGRGIVASAATYILMASANSEMSENSWLMIHNVAGMAYGNVNEVENQARTLRKFNDRIAAFYSEKTGLSLTVIGNMMDKESWLTAEEAEKQGFVKKRTPSVNFSNSIKPEQWLFENKAVLNSYNSFTNSNNSEMDIQKIKDAFAAEFTNLKSALGIKTEDQVQTEAVQNFSNNVVNIIKENVPTQESIQEMVNTAVANVQPAAPVLPENLATIETVNQIVTDATKDAVNKDVLNTELEKFKNEITTNVINKLGNKSETPTKTETNKVIKNRFAGANYEAV